jgi:DnaJ like chaperone protein
MSLWSRIADLVNDAVQNAGAALDALVDAVKKRFVDKQARRQVAFTVAMIALSAKMAKADGVVTQDEMRAFRDLVSFPESEAKNVARLYNLAKQDVAGYQAYARKLSSLFEPQSQVLEDILDGLFHIAKADGVIHENEEIFLRDVAGIFGISDIHFEGILCRHVKCAENDPYDILGVVPGTDIQDIKKQYRKLVAENHPDKLIARGVPPEFIKLANDRVALINTAWRKVQLLQSS